MNESIKLTEVKKDSITPHSDTFKQVMDLKSIGEELRSPGFQLLGAYMVGIYASEITPDLQYKVLNHFPKIINDQGEYGGMSEGLTIQSLDAAKSFLKSYWRKK